jgi:hypothetical protein
MKIQYMQFLRDEYFAKSIKYRYVDNPKSQQDTQIIKAYIRQFSD